MNYTDANTAIESLFNQNWSYTPIAWLNVDFDSEGVAEWIRVSYDGIDGMQVEMGHAQGNCQRFIGLLTVQIFTAINQGTKRTNELADAVVRMVTGKNLEGIQFRTASARQIGQNGSWNQINVNCEFYFHDFI